MSKDYDGVQVVILDWDKECKTDFMLGRGFRITEPGIKKKTKLYNGIQSPRFCSDWSDDDAFSERYICSCGEYKGKVYEGEICPYCNTEVKFKDVDLRITGWIILDNHVFIHPIMYNMIASVIGERVLEEIITYDKRIDRDGNLSQKESNNPFYGIGIMEFKERFYEIMYHYRAKKKTKTQTIDMLIDKFDVVFQSSLPVYSSVLRPLQFKGESLLYTAIDRKYNAIFTSVRLLNDIELFEKRKNNLMTKKKEHLELGNILSKIQSKIMELWDLVFEQIDQKTGHIKGELLGGKLNFSSRNVIIPDPKLRPDEVILNYTAFLELFKYEIIACLMKIGGISGYVAYDQWSKARVKYNSKIYEIMKYIIEKNKPKILINRNPTINYGSISCVKIVDVKNSSPDDYTMSMPVQILPLMNADQSRSEDRVIYLVNFANA